MEATNTTIQASQIVCQGCANTATAAVRRISGVEEASVDLAAQTVTVTHKPKVTREALVGALTKVGFPSA